MDFKDQIRILSEKIQKMQDQIQTEEATKNAFIMPFINILGYDIFNPGEVVPEYVADIGIKKGEKVDYAILKDSTPIILIECKWCGENLDVHSSQLFRYFHTTKSRFALLTNGVIYKFYSDLVEPNKMDEKPFLEFNICDLRDSVIEELKKFHKSYFDIEQILSAASELKYANEIKTLMSMEFTNPSESFIRYFAKQIYPKMVTEKVISQFSGIVKKSLQQLINDIINERLKSAINKETESTKEDTTTEDMNEKPVENGENRIQTTAMELEGFFIVKSILRNQIDPGRIYYRDTQSYLNILLDDTIRKQICRLYLNGQKKYIGLFENKKETRTEITNVDDIYKYSDMLVKTVLQYNGGE